MMNAGKVTVKIHTWASYW